MKYDLSMAKKRLSAFLRFLYENRTSGARSGAGGTSATKVETSSGNAASKYTQSAARTMSGGLRSLGSGFDLEIGGGKIGTERPCKARS